MNHHPRLKAMTTNDARWQRHALKQASFSLVSAPKTVLVFVVI